MIVGGPLTLEGGGVQEVLELAVSQLYYLFCLLFKTYLCGRIFFSLKLLTKGNTFFLVETIFEIFKLFNNDYLRPFTKPPLLSGGGNAIIKFGQFIMIIIIISGRGGGGVTNSALSTVGWLRVEYFTIGWF